MGSWDDLGSGNLFSPCSDTWYNLFEASERVPPTMISSRIKNAWIPHESRSWNLASGICFGRVSISFSLSSFFRIGEEVHDGEEGLLKVVRPMFTGFPGAPIEGGDIASQSGHWKNVSAQKSYRWITYAILCNPGFHTFVSETLVRWLLGHWRLGYPSENTRESP